jgi:hypothetical protein
MFDIINGMPKINPSEIELRRSAVMSPAGLSVPVDRDRLLALLEELQRLSARDE